MSLNVGSFFAGAGGLDFGFQNAGFNLLWANELEKSFCDSYAGLVGHDSHPGDFWLEHKKMPDVDVIIGGPPCQSFSLVGKRLSEDPRGKLVSGFKDLIIERRPRAFLLENVPGLAASKFNGERLPDYLVQEFQKAGYTMLKEKVDATDSFVPQRRKRLILIGVLNPSDELRLVTRESFAEHLLKRTGIEFSLSNTTSADALSDLPKASVELVSRYDRQPSSPYAKLMRIGAGDSVSLQRPPTMSALDREFVNHIPPGGNYLDIPDEISTKRILNFKATGGRTTTYGRLAADQPSYTVNTYFNRPNVGSNYHYEELRLITVREALRLQSFPDRFTPQFKSQRELHVQIGNAVPPLMAESLALTMKSALGAKK